MRQKIAKAEEKLTILKRDKLMLTKKFNLLEEQNRIKPLVNTSASRFRSAANSFSEDNEMSNVEISSLYSDHEYGDTQSELL